MHRARRRAPRVQPADLVHAQCLLLRLRRPRRPRRRAAAAAAATHTTRGAAPSRRWSDGRRPAAARAAARRPERAESAIAELAAGEAPRRAAAPWAPSSHLQQRGRRLAARRVSYWDRPRRRETAVRRGHRRPDVVSAGHAAARAGGARSASRRVSGDVGRGGSRRHRDAASRRPTRSLRSAEQLARGGGRRAGRRSRPVGWAAARRRTPPAAPPSPPRGGGGGGGGGGAVRRAAAAARRAMAPRRATASARSLATPSARGGATGMCRPDGGRSSRFFPCSVAWRGAAQAAVERAAMGARSGGAARGDRQHGGGWHAAPSPAGAGWACLNRRCRAAPNPAGPTERWPMPGPAALVGRLACSLTPLLAQLTALAAAP